jgi:hypothetical protein
VVEGYESVDITFRFPDAAAPATVEDGSLERRVLAFAFLSLGFSGRLLDDEAGILEERAATQGRAGSNTNLSTGIPSMAEDLRAYWHDGLEKIHGWVDPKLLDYLLLIDEIQRGLVVTGNIAEIGVFEGRFLLALAHLAAPHEKCVAIDVFEDQQFNIDGSSPGIPVNFDSNWTNFAPSHATLVKIRADSLTLTLFERVDIGRQHGPFRLFSVDGGHTVDHVMNDVAFAQDTLAPGGVIMVDDYFNAHWPGVNEGLQNFVASGKSKVKPFLFVGNKLFMCSVSFHKHYLRVFTDRLASVPRHKVVRMLGWDTLAYSDR